MRKTAQLIAAIALLAVIGAPGVHAAEEPEVVDLLVLTETAGFRHSSIMPGLQMLQDLAENETLASVDFTVTHAPNSMGEGPLPNAPAVFGTNVSHMIANQTGPSVFTDENLANFDVVVFISTTGDVLNAGEQAAFERFIQAGGGYVGIHAASDMEYGWPWYGDFVGGWFKSHPSGTPTATIDVEDGGHVSTGHLPTRWTRVDEWYNYRANPRSYDCVSMEGTCGVRVLLTMDETSYAAGNDAMGDHPIAWCNEWDGGRAWYTGLGHTNASYTEQGFVDHVLGGLLTAADIEGLDESPDFAGADLTFDCEPETA